MRSRFLVLALTVWTCSADTLRFRDGSSLTGSFLGGSASEVQFLVNNQVQSYPKADILDILFGPVRPPAPVRFVPRIAVEPDAYGMVYLQGPNDKLLSMEHTTATRTRSGGFSGPNQYTYRLFGAHSPVRLREGEKLTMIVKLAAGIPVTKFQLFAMESKRDYRQVNSTSSGRLPPSIPLTFIRVGESSWSITPARPLGRGEYSITPNDSNESFCFGVD